MLATLRTAIRPAFLGAGLAGGVIGAASASLTLPWEPEAERRAAHAKEAEAPAPALSPDEWRSFQLEKVDWLTHNTATFRFALPKKDQTIGLTVASCLVTRAPIGEEKSEGGRKMVIRPYTPASKPDEKGYFDMIIKVYPQGTMSKHIGQLKVGDLLECKGPIPKLPYKANMKKEIGMVCGGSGLTPMLQVAYEILRNPQDKTQVTMLFANQSEDDIILKQELDNFAKEHSNFKIHYVVDKARSKDFNGSVGRITKDVLQQHMPKPGSDVLILVCGPPPMMKSISGDKESPKSQGPLSGALKELGYNESQVFKF